jgi:hypothetical protein
VDWSICPDVERALARCRGRGSLRVRACLHRRSPRSIKCETAAFLRKSREFLAKAQGDARQVGRRGGPGSLSRRAARGAGVDLREHGQRHQAADPHPPSPPGLVPLSRSAGERLAVRNLEPLSRTVEACPVKLSVVNSELRTTFGRDLRLRDCFVAPLLAMTP